MPFLTWFHINHVYFTRTASVNNIGYVTHINVWIIISQKDVFLYRNKAYLSLLSVIRQDCGICSDLRTCRASDIFLEVAKEVVMTSEGSLNTQQVDVSSLYPSYLNKRLLTLAKSSEFYHYYFYLGKLLAWQLIFFFKKKPHNNHRF